MKKCLAFALLLSVATAPMPVMAADPAVVMEMDPGLPTHTIYRPAGFAAGDKAPVLLWANGGCRNLGNSAANFLGEIAAHGYVVIAVGPIGELPARPAQAAPAAPEPDRDTTGKWVPATNTSHVLRGLDWIMAEAVRAGSRYAGHIDTGRIAVAGTSCGGLMALDTSMDARIKTSLIFNSGTFENGYHPEGVAASKANLARLHGPVIYVTGGPADVAYPQATDDVTRIKQVPVYHADRPVGHSGTYREPKGGAYGDLAVAWLDWRLRSEKAAAARFAPSGDLGTSKGWKIVAVNPDR